MKTLFITVGISGSGKTKLSERVAAALNIDHHSSDAIRGEVCNGNESDQSKNGLVFKILHERIDKSLSEGRSVIADTTAIAPKSRKEFRQMALKHGAKTVALVMTTPLEESIQYNNDRARVVPVEAIHRQFNSLIVPDNAEMNEVAYVNWKDDIAIVNVPGQLPFDYYSINEFIQRYV